MSFFSLLLLQPIIMIMHKLFRAAKNNILFAYYYYYEDVICLHWYNNLTIIFCSSQCSGILFVKIELAFWWWMHGTGVFNNIGMHIIRNAISPGLFTISMVSLN